MVTNAYSKKITGYALADNMEAAQMKQALQMAIKNRKNNQHPLIHHSDRGMQYCSAEYISIANHYQIKMSITEKDEQNFERRVWTG